MELETIQQQVKETLSPKRYQHSCGVMKRIEELAKNYGVDQEQAKKVGIAHDIAKEMPIQQAKDYIQKNKIQLDPIEQQEPGLWHSKIGADLCKKQYGFNQEMVDAIIYHTTGKKEMGILAKLLYVADKTEEGRTYLDLDPIVSTAKKDIDEAILYISKLAIEKSLQKDSLIHPDTIELINHIVQQKRIQQDKTKKQKNITIQDILEQTGGTLIFGKPETICETITIDTRNLQKGDTYIGIKGENFDGNTLYQEALQKGAKLCILENTNIPKEIPEKYQESAIILVENTITALQKLAEYKRSLYHIPVIAVTGSVGKTSTRNLISSILEQEYKVLQAQKNFNNHIGLPLTLLQLKDHTAVVVEMGMNALGEIKTLTNIAKPTMCVITNIGTAHIGKLGSRQNILKAKLEILEGMKQGGTLILNNDNDMLQEWKKQQTDTPYTIKTFGIENQSDNMATNIELQEKGSKIQVLTKQETIPIEIPIAGKHFIYNTLCAISVAKQLGISTNHIIQGIKNVKITEKRMQLLTNKQGVDIINDCYNASYDSVKAAIEYLAKRTNPRKIAILGDMLELGEYAQNLHEKIAEEIVKQQIDLLITVGKESKATHQKAKQLGMEPSTLYHFDTTKEAIPTIQTILKTKDAVLIKASNGMKFFQIIEAIQ